MYKFKIIIIKCILIDINLFIKIINIINIIQFLGNTVIDKNDFATFLMLALSDLFSSKTLLVGVIGVGYSASTFKL